MSDEQQVKRPIGSELDELGVRCELGENDRIVDALVLLRVQSLEDGESSLRIEVNPEIDFLVRRGMFEVAYDFEHAAIGEILGEDDDD
ncbi:hypothetical protein [Saccharopolyspora mangrovi]|uniref:Uncharacterized protein n=1 Tax=Saccharopolyspora mangrovi TaxID=3082379 RepID=A0ABU6A7G3_9PSEU|nr:hypothetical protein [Saccharopolyspora sp. S2-29]MEB3367397.1 hypothetical protein [Saccharopolyspora sp. S2-29]